MEAQAQTREMTVEQAASLARASHPEGEGDASPEEPVPAKTPVGPDAPPLTLENRMFLEALTSQDGSSGVAPKSEPDPASDAPTPVEAAEVVEPRPRKTRRPRSRKWDVPVYEEEDFFRELKRELSKCKRVDRPLTLIVIQVGDLSQIVELFGKEYHESVLWHVAEQAMASLREVDLVGLMSSSDRIAMTAFASDRYGGGRIVSRMRKAVERNPFPVGGEIPPIIPVLNFGMASFPHDGDDVSCLMAKAESELEALARDESTTGASLD